MSAQIAPVLPIPDSIGDAEAVGFVLGGNDAMFEVIVRRYNPLLYRLGMAYLRSHARAEDAMQNAYIKAFRALASYRGGASFSTWISRIMINECLMALRSGRKASEDTVDIDAVPGGVAAPPAEDALSLNEMKALLEKSVATLPRKYRAVYLLREVQQLSVAETAACLGISRESVKVDLFRAREKLKAAVLASAEGVELFPYPAVHCDGMVRRVMAALAAGV